MTTIRLPDGTTLPALGLGTWRIGESGRTRAREVAAIRLALDLGYRVIDTAEMYGEGGAEEVVGQAVAQALRVGAITREQVFVVTKVYPHHASRRGVATACENSLRRLGLDHVDLYLLHWPGAHPLHETVAGFEALRSRNRIARWGVSNFDLDDMNALFAVAGADRCAANQVYYSPSTRGVEFDLLPWMRQRAMPLMAYCPLDQGGLARDGVLGEIGRRIGASASQVALAWLIGRGDVLPIPKAASQPHLRANLAALDLVLDAADAAAIDARFPAPQRKVALAMR